MLRCTQVHTVDDIAIGCGLGVLVAMLWLRVHSHVNTWIDGREPHVPVLMLAVIIGALTFTRAIPPTRTPSHRQSSNISGLLSGMLLATWATGRETGIPERFPPFAGVGTTVGASGDSWDGDEAASASIMSSLWIVVARLAVGLGMAFGGEQIIKACATPFFSKLLGEQALGYKSDRVYIPVKYLSQTWMAIGACFVFFSILNAPASQPASLASCCCAIAFLGIANSRSDLTETAISNPKNTPPPPVSDGFCSVVAWSRLTKRIHPSIHPSIGSIGWSIRDCLLTGVDVQSGSMVTCMSGLS